MKLVKQITLVLMLVLPFTMFGQKKGVAFKAKAGDYTEVMGSDSNMYSIFILTTPQGGIYQAFVGQRHAMKITQYVDSAKSPIFQVVIPPAGAPDVIKGQIAYTWVNLLAFEGWSTDPEFVGVDDDPAAGNATGRNRNNTSQATPLPAGITAGMRITSFTTFTGANTTEITTQSGAPVVAWTKMLEGKDLKREEIYHISTTGPVTRSVTTLYFHATGEKVTYLNGVEQGRSPMN
jgi:hypothetical protein